MALKKKWRDSASLIVLAQKFEQFQDQGRPSLEILFQKRSKTASSFPNTLVFPGGVTEKSDSNDKWIQYIKSFGYSKVHFDTLWTTKSKVAPMFSEDPLRRHIGLRITAIREAFEELGLLICRREDANTTQPNCLWTSAINDFDVKDWQKKVHNNSEEFFNLCKHLKCCPDIFSLYYWSNWLTPPTYNTRFDTAFFLVGFKQKPPVVAEDTEVVDFMWSKPKDILDAYKKGDIELMPPQIYELNRFVLVDDLEQLLRHARVRSAEGHGCISPIIMAAKDGYLALLPGDSLYPEDFDPSVKVLSRSDRTVLELRQECATLNRVEATNDKRQFVINNYSFIEGFDKAVFDFTTEAWKLTSDS